MRKHDMSVDLDATPDEVFEAITNADKIASWFAPIANVTPGVGGSITLSWGEGMEGTAPIRMWEPGKRFGWVEREESGSPRVVEFTIAAREGGGSTLRLVHSGFGDDASFDGEFEGHTGGWLTFLAMLRHGVARIQGGFKNVWSLSMTKEPQPAMWGRMLEALRIGEVREGEAYTAMVGPLEIAGVVLRNPKPGYLCLKVGSLEDSLLAVFVEGGKQAMITLEWVLYGDTVRRADEVRQAMDSLLAVVLKES